MLISIVTPSFNQDRFIEETIRSVLSQDYPHVEYAIVDGGSTDNTASIIKKYEDKLAWWVSEKDQGQTDAINKGFPRARGEILAWINSDDTYEPGAFTAAVTYFQEHPDVGMIYGDCNYINESGNVIGKFNAAQTSYRLLRQGYTHIPQQTMFLRADLWKQVGPLDPSFYFAMDYDLWTRLAPRAPIKYIPQTWANFRLHTSGKTIRADERCWPEMLRVHYRDGGSFFSAIVAKYYLRKFIAPIWNRRRHKMLEKIPKSGDFGVPHKANMHWLFSPPSFDDLIRLLKAWRFWSVGALIGALLGAGLYYVAPPPYRAHAIVIVDFNLEQAWPKETDRQQFYYLEHETRKLEEIAWSDMVMGMVVEGAGDITTEELRNGTLWLSQPAEGGWNFYAEDKDPERAATLASTWSQVFVEQVSLRTGLLEGPNGFIEATRTQIAQMPRDRSLAISTYLIIGAIVFLAISSFFVLFFSQSR